MKKFLCLILIILMLPLTMILSACGKNSGYNLNNLSSDFYSIANIDGDNIIKNNNQIMFYYSHHEHNSKLFFNNAINKAPYSNIKTYNEVFNNLMLFSYKYIDSCSNNSIDVDKETKNNLKSSLDDLHVAIKDVDSCTNLFAELLKITPENKIETDKNCLQRFEYLISAYENLLQKASYFSTDLEKVYFNHVLNNTSLANVELTSFNVSDVSINFDARIKSQISNLTKVFVEMYVCNESLSEEIKSGKMLAEEEMYINYTNNVGYINKNITSQKINTEANKNKETFYNYSVKASNAQVILYNEISNFIVACKKINYVNVKNNLATSSNEEKLNKLIIESFNTLLLEYNKVLIDMIEVVNN